jgi:hypothetical protein
MSPERAYRGLPDDVALAAAIVDSLVWDDPEWVASVAAWQGAEPPPLLMSSEHERIMAEHGWTCAQDILDEAHVTPQQAEVLRYHALGWDHWNIAQELGIPVGTSWSQLSRAFEKLNRFVGCKVKGVDSEGMSPWVPQPTFVRPKAPYLVLSERQMRRRREREIPSGAEFEAIPSAGRERDGRRSVR